LKRPILLGIVIGVFAGCAINVVKDGEARHYQRACPQHVVQGYEAKAKYVRCEAERINPPGTPEFALSVARCESGVRAHAVNGIYKGVYQHHIGYWPGRYDTFTSRKFEGDGTLRPSVFAFRSNVIVTMRMARAGGWSPWSCA
jgi:hypothetical protein